MKINRQGVVWMVCGFCVGVVCGFCVGVVGGWVCVVGWGFCVGVGVLWVCCGCGCVVGVVWILCVWFVGLDGFVSVIL